ncbi:hypothetical protein C8R44DRAFT_772402 [Mycena epipterygia]|nr:hypothetical protein C8R44DRAFT_772402 [Mycena epipterygia]
MSTALAKWPSPYRGTSEATPKTTPGLQSASARTTPTASPWMTTKPTSSSTGPLAYSWYNVAID